MTFLISKKIKHLIAIIKNHPDWSRFEYFDPDWEKRIIQMAKYIEYKETVVDLGCGQLWLKKYIQDKRNYTPVDYKKRSRDTIVCDFNKKEFPKREFDTAFISGCLEYVNEFDWFINMCCIHSRKVILSYCTTDYYPDLDKRKIANWVNNLSKINIISIFETNGFTLVGFELTKSKNSIFIFKKK